MPVSGPLKWHGGKAYLAPRIVALMPPRCKAGSFSTAADSRSSDDPGWLHYVEPYFGGGAVMLAMDPEGISEVANDLDGALTNFWWVLSNEDKFRQFVRRCQATPFCEDWWRLSDRDAPEHLDEVVPAAWSFFIHCRQSLAGRGRSFAPISRARTRGGMNEQVSAWLTCVEGLPAVHARMKRVLVLNRDALDVIKEQDGPRTLFYLDPPYLDETRAGGREYGEYEMTEAQHVSLLRRLHGIEGRFLLSGYRSPVYDEAADKWGWRRVDFDLPNNAAGGKEKRRMTESVWMNYDPPPAALGKRLIDVL